MDLSPPQEFLRKFSIIPLGPDPSAGARSILPPTRALAQPTCGLGGDERGRWASRYTSWATDMVYVPFLMPILPLVPEAEEQKGNRRWLGLGGWEVGTTHWAALLWLILPLPRPQPCGRRAPAAPTPPSREDSTSPRSWLGSAGPRRVGGGESLLLSQQLLLPLPVLLKLWLWTQGGGGSQSPAAPATPHPPTKVNLVPLALSAGYL